MDFSVVIVSFKSYHLIEKHVQSIEKKNQIIVIENSLDTNLKEKLEKLYSNVEVIIPESNLGYGGALNLGIKKSKSNFVFCMVADVSVSRECFFEISNIINQFEDFAILAPTYFDETVYKNYKLNIDNNNTKRKILSYIIKEVDDIDGAILIINKNEFKSPEIMDEKIFLYFESTDLCVRLRKDNKKLYVIENLKFEHFGTQSSHSKFEKQVLICRNWHYCWSKFYFFHKHNNYFIAFKKTLPNFLRSLKKCIYYKFKKDNYNFQLHKAEMSGLINAYLLRSSFYRPKVD